MEWVASILHTTSEHGVSSVTTADAHTSADVSADLIGLVRFAERRNLVSARMPSHFKRSLPPTFDLSTRLTDLFQGMKLSIIYFFLKTLIL